MSDSSRSQPVWQKWVSRIAGICFVLGPIAYLALRGKTLWPVLQAFYKAGMRFNKEVTVPQFSYAAGTVVGALVLIGLGFWLLRRSEKKSVPQPKSEGAQPAETPASPESVAQVATRRPRTARKVNYSSCLVLNAGADGQRLWQFDAHAGDFKLAREQVAGAGESLPAWLVSKTWSSLWQRKLNVAWLPPQSVFLRVAHLPKSTLEETVSMVELQLEKLSPIPVTQVVWSVHTLTQSTGDLQTVIVLLAERRAVEEFLGQLEGQGYLADRLEVPALDQLEAIPESGMTEDGAWIFPEAIGGRDHALVAWWYDGALQNLDLVSLPVAGDRAAGVKAQLMQIAWAGELEGWLTSSPDWHLVADEALAAEWEPALRQGLDEPIHIIAPVQPAELAASTAKRTAGAPGNSNLLPPEFATRYQQQFVDRLWLRGLLAVGGVYVLGVLVYALALFGFYLRTQRVENHIAEISNQYTNAMQLKAKYQVLKDRQDLKYAALDCWKAVADVMPNEITLNALNFTEGRKLTLNGTAPGGEGKAILDFFDQVRKTMVAGQPLFDTTQGDSAPRSGTGPGGVITWNFALELKRGELP